MRLSKRHEKIIELMKEAGYFWLSDLPRNAQMRFRNKTKKGFKGYIKVEGLTFLTERVAKLMEAGAKTENARLTLKEQLVFIEQELIELENELYENKKIGTHKLTDLIAKLRK